MNRPIAHEAKMRMKGTLGTTLRRSKFFTKVLPLTLLAFFIYNSLDNSSVEIYRQLYEAAGDTPSQTSGKVDGKFKFCRTPYVLMGHLLSTVPKVIPPKDRMDSPSHVQLCQALLDRVDVDQSKLKSLPTVSVKEDPAVCVDWSAPHHAVISIFASSLIAALGVEYGLKYSHECHKFITHTREGNTHYDYTTAQEVLPENLISAQDAASVDLELVKDLCSSCIAEHDGSTPPDSYDGTTNHCFLFPGGAAANDLVEKKHELPLSTALSSFVDRMRHLTEDWIDATSPIKFEDASGVIVSLDAKSTFMDFSYYDAVIPFQPSSVQIFASANCAVASISKKSNCIEHGRALKSYFKQKFPTVYVRFDIVASTATSFARMMNAKLLVCPPGTVNCLLPALGKLAGKKAVIAEDGSRPGTFHWFQNLMEKRKKLGLFKVGFDPVSDEDYLVISEQTSKEEMPRNLPLDELDTEEYDQPLIEGPKETPFDLNLDNLFGHDIVAKPEDFVGRSSNQDYAEDSTSENAGSANDRPINSFDATKFNSLIGKVANIGIPSDEVKEEDVGTSQEVVLNEAETPEVVVVPKYDNSETSVDVGTSQEVVLNEAETPEVVEVPKYDNSETSVDVESFQERKYDQTESEVNVSLPKMSAVDVAPQMSEVDVPDSGSFNDYNDASAVGRSIDVSPSPLEPVYDFWNDENQDHTFHFGEPWEGETKGNVQFYAYSKHAPGTEPVYKFWNGDNSEYTCHFGDPWEGEIKQGVAFYSYPKDVEELGLLPVQVYFDESKKSHTFHAGDPWPGEIKKDMIAFYAARLGEARL